MPEVGDIVAIVYKNRGNGPWNYMMGSPPPGITHWVQLGVWVGENKMSYLTAHSFGHNGTEPVSIGNQNWPKDGSVEFRVIGKSTFTFPDHPLQLPSQPPTQGGDHALGP